MASTPSLLDFPNEVLLRLCEVTPSEDLVNSAITCRQFYPIARGVLEHRQLMAIHRHITVADNRPSELFLKYCVQERRLSPYPETMTLFAKDRPAKNQDHQATRDQVQEMAIKKGELFLSKRVVSLLDELDGQEFDGAMAAVLSQCLPNLEKIEFVDDLSHFRSPQAFIDGLMIGITAFSTNGIVSHVFPHLSSFSVTRNYGQMLGTDVESFLPVLLLPNLRLFETSNHDCSSFYILPFPRRTSKVETLRLYLKRCSVHSISTLFRAFEALRTLKVSFTHGIAVQGEVFSTLFDSLLENHRDSLERLELSDPQRRWYAFSSLRPFSVLKLVIIDVELIPRDGHVTHRLVDLFPRSIQGILINGVFDMTQEMGFFRGFLQE